MNICVVNGSPRGKYSITLQTILYLKAKFKEHKFDIMNIGQQIRIIEKDEKALEEIIARLKNADLIIFSYPVYTFIAPSQLHRFVELIKASETDLSGKYVTQITTSKHFYDITAHRYIEENCHDMKMKVIHGLSADMDDLLEKRGQEDAQNFFNYVIYCTENDIYEAPPKCNNEVNNEAFFPEREGDLINNWGKTEKSSKYDVAIVADIDDDDHNLKDMISWFRKIFPYATRIVNIAEYPFKGGCLGCFNCAGDGKCVYKDGFDEFLRGNIQKADAVVYGFSIKDHSMGARFKMYDDRQFCNGHRTVTEGMPFGYIVNGDLPEEENLRTIIEGRCEVGHNFLSGVGYSEKTLRAMSKRLTYALQNHYLQPRNFYGVGGMKIFRDLIWLMRGLMKADHRYYKEHGVYDDFPQRHRIKMIKMSLLGALVRNPKVKAKMGNKMNEGMVAPYKKILDEAEKQQSPK